MGRKKTIDKVKDTGKNIFIVWAPDFHTLFCATLDEKLAEALAKTENARYTGPKSNPFIVVDVPLFEV